MFPDTLHIGPIPIHLFGICLAAAFLIAGQVAAREYGRSGLDPDLASSVVVAAVLGGLIGARLWLVLGGWSDFTRDPIGFLFTGSGFVFYGGLIGGTAAVSLTFRRHGVPWLTGADASAPAIVVGQAVGRIGCQLAGDGDWGTVTDLPWGMAYPHAVVGWPHPEGVYVHPTPIYEMLAYGAVFVLLLMLRRRSPAPGVVLGSYLVLASTARFLVEFIRINPRVLFDLTSAQLTSIVLVGTGAALILRGRRWRRAAG